MAFGGRGESHGERLRQQFFHSCEYRILFDGFLEGIPDARDFLVRLRKVLGGQVEQGAFNLNLRLKWDGPKEAKAVKAKVQEMELELRHLRSDFFSVLRLVIGVIAAVTNAGKPPGEPGFWSGPYIP